MVYTSYIICSDVELLFGRVVDGATILAPRQCKRPQTSLQTSAVLDEVCGNG